MKFFKTTFFNIRPLEQQLQVANYEPFIITFHCSARSKCFDYIFDYRKSKIKVRQRRKCEQTDIKIIF